MSSSNLNYSSGYTSTSGLVSGINYLRRCNCLYSGYLLIAEGIWISFLIRSIISEIAFVIYEA